MILWMSVACTDESQGPRIAIASLEKSVESTINIRAARSPYFLIFAGSEFIEAVDNPLKGVGASAGPKAANWLAEMHIDIVVAGIIGDKMRDALEEKEISYIEFKGTVEDGLQSALAGVDRNERNPETY